MTVPSPRGPVTLLFLPLLVLGFDHASLGTPTTATNSTTLETTNTSLAAPYRLLTSDRIKKRLEMLQVRYPDLIRVETAQDKFGLPVAGDKMEDCQHEAGKGCLNYYATIQDFVVHPEGSASSNRLPAVLLSGALHGDERVGPTAVLEMAQLVLRAASCEAELTEACRRSMAAMGISDSQRRWLARLVTTRRLVIVPTANALGYDRGQREEGEIDVNRDFPFDVLDVRDCMRTIAARTLNELYRSDQFQMSVTFHAGLEVIGYQWGAESYWDNPVSPDDEGQYEVAKAMSRFAGSFNGTAKYPFGINNLQVYPVRGGFEDWAYAASWDKAKTLQCEPESYGGYPQSKTEYSSGTLRSFVMLVETSSDKTPAEDTLGSSQQILRPRGTGSGHVSRNVRLALLAMDIVEPHVTIQKFDGRALASDLVPQLPRPARTCKSHRSVAAPKGSTPSLTWTVGGAISVDETKVWFARWSDVPEDKLDCLFQPSTGDVEKYMTEGALTSAPTGSGRFSVEGETVFSAQLDLTGFVEGEEIAVIAAARVDSSWAKVPVDVAPSDTLIPQTHIVQARTNSSWLSTHDGKVVQGRDYWYSSPLTVTIL